MILARHWRDTALLSKPRASGDDPCIFYISVQNIE